MNLLERVRVALPRGQRLAAWISPILLLAASCAAVAAPDSPTSPTFPTPLSSAADLGNGILYLEDISGEMTFGDVRTGKHSWQVNSTDTFNRGFSRSAWWLRFNLHNTGEQQSWLLEIAYPVLDYVDAYIVREQGEIAHLRMGDKFPFHQRPIPHRHFTVPLSLEKNKAVSVYLRVKSSSAIQVPLTLWPGNAFTVYDTKRSIIAGMFFGGLLIIALYNLFIYFVLGERAYLYYVGYVFGVLMFFASLNGWNFQYLWPHGTQWNDTSILFFLSTLLFFAWAFAGVFLETPKLSRLFYRVHYASLIIIFVLAFLSLLLPYGIAIRFILPVALFSCIWGFVSGFAAWKQGNSSARYYLLAWSMFSIGSIVMALNKFQILPRNIVTDFSIQIGMIMDVLLFSFALADRINTERSLRLQAQQEALLMQRKTNEELERRVEQRTQELEQTNRKLQDLSDTDQLTGLKNRRYLNNILEKEFARAYYRKKSIAVLLIDVDHFKEVNDAHGHLVGDECLREIAQRIMKQMRWPQDLATRYGGEEFCVVLPETGEEGAMTVAERIRISVETEPVTCNNESLNLTVSIGINVNVPASDAEATDFFAIADKALYQAKSNGRNCSVRLD